MLIDRIPGQRVEGHKPAPRIIVSAETWRMLTGELAAGRMTLSGLWGDADKVHMALLQDAEIVVVTVECEGGKFPSVGQVHPPAIRLERAIQDLWGAEAADLPDRRPWLDHGRWGVKHPLGTRVEAHSTSTTYQFLPSEGESLHQIAVGPVHAGIIEPGHFRFTVNGETVVRLEERLGYVHKGIESLMAGASIETASRLAGRTSGDSTVAYALAFANAVEAAAEVQVPARAVHPARLDGRSRTARQSPRRYRRDLQRRLFRPDACALRRFTRERAARSQCRIRPSPDARYHRARWRRPATSMMVDALRSSSALDNIRLRFPALVELYDNTASLQDRTVDTGVLKPALGQTIRRRRLHRPCVGAILRRAPHACLSAL